MGSSWLLSGLLTRGELKGKKTNLVVSVGSGDGRGKNYWRLGSGQSLPVSSKPLPLLAALVSLASWVSRRLESSTTTAPFLPDTKPQVGPTGSTIHLFYLELLPSAPSFGCPKGPKPENVARREVVTASSSCLALAGDHMTETARHCYYSCTYDLPTYPGAVPRRRKLMEF